MKLQNLIILKAVDGIDLRKTFGKYKESNKDFLEVQELEDIFGQSNMKKEIYDKFPTYKGLEKYNFGLK